MKNPIVHTQFLEDICEELTYVFANLGAKRFTLTPETFPNRIQLAFDVVNQARQQAIADYNSEELDFADAMEVKETIEWLDKLTQDLTILADLEGTNYATPNHIAYSIETISEKLVNQLQGKAHNEAYYNEYYCKRLAEVLNELCELIKEA